MISSEAIEASRKQQQQQQADQWSALQAHFANRGKPREPDPALMQRIADDNDAAIRMERARKAEADAQMAALQEVFRRRNLARSG